MLVTLDRSYCLCLSVSIYLLCVSICVSVLSCVIYCYLSVVFMGHAAWVKINDKWWMMITFRQARSYPCNPEGCYQFRCLENRGTMGVNSLRKTVTRQRRDCDLNPGPSAPESSTLTTRLIVTYVSGVEWCRPTFLSGAHCGVTVYSYISARLYIAAVRSNLQYQLWWLMNDDADCCVHYRPTCRIRDICSSPDISPSCLTLTLTCPWTFTLTLA